MRRGVKWALGGVGAVAALVVAGGVLILNQNFTTAAARYAIEKLDKQIPAKIVFEHLSVNPYRGRIAIDKFAMTIPGKPQEKFAEARQIIVELDVLALIGGKVKIQRLHLVNPEVAIIHRGGNQYNLTEIIPKSDQPEKDKREGNGAFALERVTLEGGRVTYKDDPRDVAAELPHLDANLHLDLQTVSVGGQVSLSQGWVRQARIKQPIDSFRVDFDKAGDGVRVDELKLDTGKTGLAVRGRVDGLDRQAPKLALDGMVKTDLAAYKDIAQLKPLGIAGRATVDFGVTGTTAEPRAALRVTGEGLTARKITVPKLAAAIVATKRQVQIDRFKADVWGGTVEANGVAPLERNGRLDATVAVNDLDLGRAVKDLDLKGPAAQVQGKASARVSAAGAGTDPRAYVGAGWLRAAASMPVKGRRLPLTARTDFRWTRGELSIASLDARALGARLTGAGRVAPLAKTPTYAFKGEVADVRVAAVESALAMDLPVSGRAGATIDVAGAGFEQPKLTGGARLRAAGALDARVASNKKAIPFDAVADVALAGETVVVKSANAHVFGGTVTASARAPMDGNRRGIVADVTARGIDVAALNATFPGAPGPVRGTIAAHVRMKGDAVDVDSVDARVLGGRLTASGRVLLAGKNPRYDLDVRADRLRLEDARKAMRLAGLQVDGTAGARIRVRGAGADFRAEGPVDVAGRAFVADPQTPGARRILPVSVKGSIAAAKRSVRLLPVTARLGGATLTARGTLDLDRASDLTVQGQVKDALALARLFRLPLTQGGDTTIRAHAAGPAGNLRFDGDVALGPTTAAGARVDAATLKFQGAYARELSVNGRLQARGVSSGKTRVETADLPFTYRAPTQAPAQGTASVSGMTIAFGQGRITGKASVALATRRYEADVKTAGLTLGDLTGLSPATQVAATATQTASQAGTPAATPAARPAGMDRVVEAPSGPATAPVVPVPPTTPLSLAFNGKGTFDAPAGTAQIRLGGFTHAGLAYEPSRLDVKLADEIATVDGAIFGAGAKIAGRVPLGAGDGQVKLTFQKTRLAPLFALVPAKSRETVEMPLGGLVSGTITAKGPFVRKPADVAVDVDLSELEFAYADLGLANRGPLRFDYADERLRIRSFRLAGGGTDLGASGVVALKGASSLNLEGQIDLGLLARVAPRQFADASGRAVIDGQLRGAIGDPSLAGALNIRDAELETRSLPQPVRDLNVAVRLTRDRIFLDELKATLGHTGRIQASGGATIGRNFQPEAVNLQLDAREVAFRQPGMEVVANADLVFQGRPDGGRLDGTVRVLEGEYTRDVDLTGGLTARRTAGGGGRTGGPSALDNPLLKNLALRVQVQVPDQLVIDNNLAKAELRGDLVVMGTPGKPSAVGRVEAVDGQVFFQDRTYTLEEATVDLTDPTKIAPYLHVVATSTIQDVDVRLQANGTPEQLKLDLSSSPAMSQTDVLTLIATGQTPEQIREGGGGGGGLAAASNLLLNQVAGGVSKGVTEGGVVDTLSIKPGSADASETSGGSFTVGKRINDKLTLTYTQDIAAPAGRTPGRILIFDYLLTDAVVLKLEQDLGGGFNASARYRIPIR